MDRPEDLEVAKEKRKFVVLTQIEYMNELLNITQKYDSISVVVAGNPDAIDHLESYDYDYCLCFMWPHKIPKELTDTGKFINFHPAPLPQYKGKDLSFHAVLNQETRFGATAHFIQEAVNEGYIIEVKYFPVMVYSTAGDIYKEALRKLFEIFEEIVWKISNDIKLDKYPQSYFGESHYYKEEIDYYLYNVKVDAYLDRQIRARICGEYRPKIKGENNSSYILIKEEEYKELLGNELLTPTGLQNGEVDFSGMTDEDYRFLEENK